MTDAYNAQHTFHDLLPATCDSPDCFCSGSLPNIPLEQRPQIVYLTFDDAITDLAVKDYYTSLFDGTYQNPNGCPIRATHFLTHQSTDYTWVRYPAAKGS